MKTKNVKNIWGVNARGYTLLKKVILMLVAIALIILPCRQVQAISLIAPENEEYFRWNTATFGTIDVKSFFEIYSDAGINVGDSKIYKHDNSIAGENELIATGMYLKIDNKNIKIILKGDINGDGKVTVTDLSKFKQMEVGLITLEYPYAKAGDINNDYQLTTVDHSQLMMMLVGLPIPEENREPNDKTPKLDREITIAKSTNTAAEELTVTITYPTGENIDGYTKKVSLDGAKTYQDYTGPLTLRENVIVIAAYVDKDGNTLGQKTLLIENIDREAPQAFDLIAEATTSSIKITANTVDKMKDYQGNLVENEFTGIQKYMYKINNGQWQESKEFKNLTANTEYTVYAKAIDYAGNEREARNNGMVIKTASILEPTIDGSRILVEYDITRPTCANVTVTFSLEDQTQSANYDIEYQVNGTTGAWTKGNRYIALGNCTIYARLVDKNGQSSANYVTANVANIDKLQPLEFTPLVEYNPETDKTVITANVQDAPADASNISSGIKNYTYIAAHKSGAGEMLAQNVETNTYEYSGNLFEKVENTEEDVIVGFTVDVVDNAGNYRRSKYAPIKDIPIPDGEIGIGNFNEGPGNVTIQGAEKSYSNPVIPVGFKAKDTEAASWGPYMPSGWNDGLVIEDRSGNQFVWVPVPCAEGTSGKDAIDAVILNTRTHIDDGYNEKDYFDEIPEGIANKEVETETGTYGYEYRTEIIEQVEEYQGFYIARYEAGRKDGILATQKGLETVNMVTYQEAKSFAEGMYQNPYVISGLPTGVHWDLMAEWIDKEYSSIGYGSKGNVSCSEFTFSGKYATGPDFGSNETRSAYKTGVNITKLKEDEYLLTTGIVEDFRMKNMYDILGNVWEYTSERVTLSPGIIGHDSRAADYYWETTINAVLSLNIKYRCHVPDGDARNEGGFRPILYLSDGKAKVEGDFNRTIDGGKASYNNPVIPAGYNPVHTANAPWGDGSQSAPGWDKGLVIEDKNGNQFVWVPVDNKNVSYETWLEVYLSYEEVGASEIPALWSELGGTEESSVNEFGGFYIARYETSIDERGKTQTKSGQQVKTIVSYNEAVELTNNYENGKTSVAGIVTGKQWDTTLRWIANEHGEEAVTTDSSSWGVYNSGMTLTGSRSAKNIYDMAGNAWELTSETYNGNIIYRGGAAYETGAVAPAGYRDYYEKTYKDEATTYRMVLYVKNDGYTSEKVEVPADNPGISSDANSAIKVELSPTEMTNKDVLVKMSTQLPYKISYSVSPNSTKKQGEWKTGNEVVLTENSTVLVRLVDEKGQIKKALEVIQVTNIDKEAPKEFTPTVTVEGSRVRIQCSTTDDASGIKQYHFYADDGVVIREATAETNVLSGVLSIGQHNIYVVAEDNVGNLRESGKVSVKMASARVGDVLKVWDYVSTKAQKKDSLGNRRFFASGQSYKLQVILIQWGIPVYNAKSLAIYPNYYNNDNYGNYIEFGIGSTHKIMHDGVTLSSSIHDEYLYPLLQNCLVTGGSGTYDDPYTVNFYWNIVNAAAISGDGRAMTNGTSWFNSFWDRGDILI